MDRTLEILCEMTRRESLGAGLTLHQAGLDSIDLADLAADLEEQLHLPNTVLTKLENLPVLTTTVGDLLALVKR